MTDRAQEELVEDVKKNYPMKSEFKELEAFVHRADNDLINMQRQIKTAEQRMKQMSSSAGTMSLSMLPSPSTSVFRSWSRRADFPRLDLIETRRVEEVTELLELAQQLLLRPDALKKFRDQEAGNSKSIGLRKLKEMLSSDAHGESRDLEFNVVQVRITGNGYKELQLIDLPGLIASTPKKESIGLIRQMAEKYLKKPNTLNQGVEAREKEEEFFRGECWQAAKDRCGTKQLRECLCQLLHDLVKQQLPDVQKDELEVAVIMEWMVRILVRKVWCNFSSLGGFARTTQASTDSSETTKIQGLRGLPAANKWWPRRTLRTLYSRCLRNVFGSHGWQRLLLAKNGTRRFAKSRVHPLPSNSQQGGSNLLNQLSLRCVSCRKLFDHAHWEVAVFLQQVLLEELRQRS
eukprot:symbB.v1.2.035472.t1/scaffold4778.1/size34948/3